MLRRHHKVNGSKTKSTKASEFLIISGKNKISRLGTATVVALVASLLIDPHLFVVALPIAACIILVTFQRANGKEIRWNASDPHNSPSLDQDPDPLTRSRHSNDNWSILPEDNDFGDEYGKK